MKSTEETTQHTNLFIWLLAIILVSILGMNARGQTAQVSADDISYNLTSGQHWNLMAMSSFLPTGDGGVLIGGNIQDEVFLTLLDSAGNTVWMNSSWTNYNGFTSVDRVQSIVRADDGNLIALMVVSLQDPWPLTGFDNQRGVYICKVGQNGIVIWSKFIGAGLNGMWNNDADVHSMGLDLIALGGDEYIVAGGFVEPPVAHPLFGRPIIHKFDGNGTAIESHIYDQGYNDYFDGISQTSDGGYLVHADSGGYNYYAKLDANFDPVWYYQDTINFRIVDSYVDAGGTMKLVVNNGAGVGGVLTLDNLGTVVDTVLIDGTNVEHVVDQGSGAYIMMGDDKAFFVVGQSSVAQGIDFGGIQIAGMYEVGGMMRFMGVSGGDLKVIEISDPEFSGCFDMAGANVTSSGFAWVAPSAVTQNRQVHTTEELVITVWEDFNVANSSLHCLTQTADLSAIADYQLLGEEAGVEEVQDVVITSGLGAAVFGNTHSFGSGGSDMMISVHDYYGNHLWSKAYGTAGEETLYAASRNVSNDGFVMVGTNDSNQVLVLAIDDAGLIQWEEVYDMTGDDDYLPQGIGINSSDQYVIAGSRQYQAGGDDGFVLIIDQTGTIITSDTYHRNQNNISFNEAVEMANGDYLAVGHNQTTGIVMRIDAASSGAFTGVKIPLYTNYGTNTKLVDLAIIGPNEYVLYGASDGRLIVDRLSGALSTTTDFTNLDRVSFSNPGTTYYPTDLEVADDGNFLLTGYYEGGTATGKDLFMIELDPQFNIVRSLAYGGASDLWTGAMAYMSPDDGFYLAGHETSTTNLGDYLLIRADSTGEAGVCLWRPESLTTGTPTLSRVYQSIWAPTNPHFAAQGPNGQAAQTGSISVQQTADLTLDLSSDSTLCFGSFDGSGSVVASGAVAPYQYTWSTGATTPATFSLGEGTHTITVEDSRGCTVIDSVEIFSPDPLFADIGGTNVTCSGGFDGTVFASGQGGTSPYTAFWSTGTTGDTLYNMVVGTYAVNLYDANGCSNFNVVTITEPDPLSYTITSTDNQCNGGANGSITVNAVNGTAPYTYTWSDIGVGPANRTGLTTGTYSVVIEDACGQSFTDSAQIVQPGVLAPSLTITNVSCNGGTDGMVDAFAAGGTPAYDYLWHVDGSTGTFISGQPVGTDSVTITDFCGGTQTLVYTITEPAVLTVTVNTTDATCHNGGDGVVVANATGGTMPFVYQWNSGHSTDSIAAVFAGTYSVNVVDANGCLASNFGIVNEPALMTYALSGTDVGCNGDSTGTATVALSGGTAPFTYTWSDGDSVAVRTGLPAGTYTVTIVDSCGTQYVDSITISEPAPLTGGLNITDVTCNGGSDGMVAALVSGGTMPYVYFWHADSSAASTLSNQMAFSDSVTIFDFCGDSVTLNYTISEPALLTVNLLTSNASCSGAGDAVATAIVAGGTGPYTYLWNTGHNTNQVSGLFAGNYSVNVTDINGCFASNFGTISEPAPLSISFDVINPHCSSMDGFAMATVTGGAGVYNYDWPATGDSTDTLSFVSEGTYLLNITDTNNCTHTDSVHVDIVVDPVEICMITVDSTSDHNIIVWEKTLATGIQGFNIYRNASGVYTQIGYQPYDSLSQFVDDQFGVDPNATAYRYKISVLDSCGNESDLSGYHETMHLFYTVNGQNEVTLVWDAYEGVNYTDFYIMKDTTGNATYFPIDTVSSFNFFHNLGQVDSGAAYTVQVGLPNNCQSTRASHNTTRSNRTQPIGGGEELGIAGQQDILSELLLYPNPNQGQFILEFESGSNEPLNWSIVDLQGREIKTGVSRIQLGRNLLEFRMDHVERGMYSLVLTAAGSSRSTLLFSISH